MPSVWQSVLDLLIRSFVLSREFCNIINEINDRWKMYGKIICDYNISDPYTFPLWGARDLSDELLLVSLYLIASKSINVR